MGWLGRYGAPFLALALSVATTSHADAITEQFDAALAPIASVAGSGILYDRVLPISRLDRLDGGESSPVIDTRTWRQAWDELRRASLTTPPGPDPAALDAVAAGIRTRPDIVPLAFFDVVYDRVREGALDDGSILIDAGRIVRAEADALVRSRTFAATALRPRTHRGRDVTFVLDPRLVLQNGGPVPRRIDADFADGLGLRELHLGEPVPVHYATPGVRTLTIRLTRADGTVATSRFAFDVVALATPTPDDTLHVTATIPWQGRLGTGDAYVRLAPGHTQITNPAVVIEGFDLDNTMDWDELYALLNVENLIESLRTDGYDAIVLNFTDATSPIQENSFLVAELIQEVQDAIAPSASIALVGASMGGLCSRYALAYMETHALPHRVRVWLSFDAPQEGANIPLGLQYWIHFFSGQSASAASFLTTLQRPAARQMLLYHFTTPAGTTGTADPMRDSLIADLATLGSYPTMTRRVAIANGSGTGMNQGFAASAQVIRYEYSSLLAAITGNVWAVPNQTNTRIFNGSLRILFSTTTQSVTVSGTSPWDGAPGGSRASFTQLDTTAAPYGDIVALHSSHGFIPTVSALGIVTTDPFLALGPSPATPFDAVYTPSANQEHVLVTAENAAWVRNEIEGTVLGVPSAGASRLTLRLDGPNPARGEARLAYSLPSAGVVNLAIYDAAGRCVRTLVHGVRVAGSAFVSWDGSNNVGSRVRAGLYFTRLTTDDDATSLRFVRLE